MVLNGKLARISANNSGKTPYKVNTIRSYPRFLLKEAPLSFPARIALLAVLKNTGNLTKRISPFCCAWIRHVHSDEWKCRALQAQSP